MCMAPTGRPHRWEWRPGHTAVDLGRGPRDRGHLRDLPRPDVVGHRPDHRGPARRSGWGERLHLTDRPQWPFRPLREPVRASPAAEMAILATVTGRPARSADPSAPR